LFPKNEHSLHIFIRLLVVLPIEDVSVGKQNAIGAGFGNRCEIWHIYGTIHDPYIINAIGAGLAGS
jgi:hypothetical protein